MVLVLPLKSSPRVESMRFPPRMRRFKTWALVEYSMMQAYVHLPFLCTFKPHHTLPLLFGLHSTSSNPISILNPQSSKPPPQSPVSPKNQTIATIIQLCSTYFSTLMLYFSSFCYFFSRLMVPKNHQPNSHLLHHGVLGSLCSRMQVSQSSHY